MKNITCLSILDFLVLHQCIYLSCGNMSPEFLFRVLTHLQIDLYSSDGVSQSNNVTQTDQYGHACAILKVYQLKSPRNPFKTTKLHHSDQLGGQPRTAHHLRQVYAGVFCCFFPQSKAISNSGCESLYL